MSTCLATVPISQTGSLQRIAFPRLAWRKSLLSPTMLQYLQPSAGQQWPRSLSDRLLVIRLRSITVAGAAPALNRTSRFNPLTTWRAGTLHA